MSAATGVLATLVSPAGRRDETLAAIQDFRDALTALGVRPTLVFLTPIEP